MSEQQKYTQFRGNNPFSSQGKMLYHVDRLHEYMSKGDTWPIFVEFNLTDKCNLKCEWCISANCRSKDTIEFETAIQFLWDFKNHGGKAVTFSGGGEPTLHPDFLVLMKYAVEVGLDVGLMTNGVFPPEYCQEIGTNCRWVRVSVDTVDLEKYKRLKGVNAVNVVMDNLFRLRHYPAKLGVNCNVGPDITVLDVEQLIDLLQYADYIQFRPVLPRYFCQEKVEINQTVWDYLKQNYSNHSDVNFSDDKLGDLQSHELFPFSTCEGHHFNPVVQANGDLAVCMYHPKDPNFVFGNLYAAAYPEIWTSEARQKIVRNIRKIDYNAKCQVCCKLTELNKLVDYMKHPDPSMDINFL